MFYSLYDRADASHVARMRDALRFPDRSPGARSTLSFDANAFDDAELAARRERASRAASLKLELERQMEEKRLRRERERTASRAADEAQERRARFAVETAARREADQRALARSSELEKRLEGLRVRAGAGGERREVVGINDEEEFQEEQDEEQDEEDHMFIEESTFVPLSEDEVSESVVSPIKALFEEAVRWSSPPREERASTRVEDDEDEKLIRQGSVKAMAKLWDTPMKTRAQIR